MRFFNIDLHVAVIRDIATIFPNLGHEVDDWTISGHAWVFGRETQRPDVLNRDTWRKLDQSLCDAFYERYKDELAEYDGFIVTHTPAFALLYERFEKPVITVASTRYEQPFEQNPAGRAWLNAKLWAGLSDGWIIPVANNRFDKLYCESRIVRPGSHGKVRDGDVHQWRHIESLCEYVGEPIKREYRAKEIWFDPGRTDQHPPNIPAGWTWRRRTPGHKWRDIAQCSGAVHYPYNLSQMSLFEQYWLCVPLIVPTPGCLGRSQPQLLSEAFWGEHKASARVIELADYYQWPCVQKFDLPTDIEALVNCVDWLDVADEMRSVNEFRRQQVYRQWSELLESL